MALRIVRLEERIVLDAAGAAVLAATSSADAPAADTSSTSDQASDPDATHEADRAADQAADTESTDPAASTDTPVEHQDIDNTLYTDQVIAALSETLDQGGVNVVLLDTSLTDYKQIADAVEADAVVLLYDGQTDSADEVIGLVIAYAKEAGTSIDSLSILSHGKTGEFKLGNEWIDAAHLSDHAAVWDALDAVMNDGGNIYLFGCHVAEGPAVDQALLDGLAHATQTDVFASDDATGQGGDWELEAASTGDEGELNNGLDTPLDTSALAGYSGTLAPPVILSALTVDNDGDGQIDHIRIVTDQNLDDDFSGFSATVAGYTLDGTTPYLTNIGAGGANDTTFYIKINESGSPDTNATPLVTITANTTLSNTSGENLAAITSSDTGAHPPSAYGSGTADTPTGVYADGGSDSYIAYTQYQIWSGCHLSDAIPDGATINGIEVYVDATSVGATSVSLSWNGGSNFTSTQSYSTLGVNTLGGSSDTWGRTWSKSELSDSNFNIRFAVGGINFAGSWIDYFTVKVYYTSGTSFNADDLNDTPTINDGTFAVNENVANGTAVGTVSANDPDVGDTLSYSITAGNDAGVFAINSSTGQITVANDANLDRENYSSFALTVQTSDGAATDTATITVNVNDLNDNAPVADDATVSLTENSANGTSVHTVVATDADPTATLTYSIIGGNGAGVFTIDSGTGEITVADNTNLDREAYASFALTVEISDGTNTDTATITINVSDLNEFTPVANDATVALAENSANGTSFHTVVATDADPTAALTYSIIGGNGAGVFAIDSGTGEITVANNTNLDRETYASFALMVQVSDGTNSDTATITVNVNDVNESTPVANDATVPLAENSANGTSVHTVVATDADPTAALTYSIIGGNGAGVFAINSSTGEITVANNTNLDRETYASFALMVQVSDGTNSDTATITVNVNDVNESTPVANDATVPLAENSANGTIVHTVVASDADPTDVLSYSIIGGNGAGVFAIDSGTGEITVADNTNLDREAYASFALTVEVSDGTNSDTAAVTINLTDVNDNAPTIGDDTFTIGEDTAVTTSVGTVSANDPDSTDTLTYSITAGNTGNAFAIDSATGEITVNGVLDRETLASYNLTVQVSDGTHTDTAAVTINLTDANDNAPTIGDETFTIGEDAAVAASVGTVSASDVDSDDTLTYSIIAGNTGNAFAIDSATGEITVNGVLDRETLASYNLTVQVSDGTHTDTAAVTINLTDVNDNAPTIGDDTFTIGEDTAVAASVGTVSASDVDSDDTLTYSIIAGNTGNAFAIDPATGEITVNGALDRETLASYNLTVQVSDGTHTDTATITVNVSDVNEFTPVANDATVALAENSANGTSVHTVVASDADPSATLLYAIAGGNDAGVFTIDNLTGEITVANNTNLDREVYTSFALTVQVSDGTHTDTAAVTINLTDVNDNAPTIGGDTFTIGEDAAVTTSVGTVSANDPDSTDTLTYSITAGNTGNAFAIDSATGEITVNGALDRETLASYNLTVQVSDGTHTDTAAVTINLTDVNDNAPTISDDTFTIGEDAAVAASVGTVSASDVDSDDTLTYSIIAGNTGNAFAIDSATGEITVNGALDRETLASYNLTVQVSDGTNSDTATITVNVNDVNESTPVASDATVPLAENSANGTSVHTVVATDADPTDVLSYSIIGGNGAGVFAIDSSTGEITVANNTNLDREAYASFALTVQVSDGANTDAATITVNVGDVNEFTPVASDATVALAENSANGTSVHTVVATDADPSAMLLYAITSGNDAGVFTIDNNTGEITVADNANLDRESYASFALTVQVSDGTNSDTATITVNISDVNESTPVANDATVALAENSANGTSVHTVVASDADSTAALSYSIIGGNGAGVFAINSSTGEITVGDNTNLDRESYASFALTVQVSDGTNTDTATITVNVSDVNEFAPVAIDATMPLAENSANGTSVHTVVASDADPTATLSYLIIGGNDAGVFTINNATGEITVTDNTNLDRETYASFALTVQVSDGTHTDTAAVTVNLTDVNDNAPTIGDDTFTIGEDAAVTTSVGTVSASDVDSTDTLTYSIIAGNTGNAFAIDSATGEITVNGALDRETLASYNLTVQVSDGTHTDTAAVTINLTDVNDNAPTIGGDTFTIGEDAAVTTSVGTVSANDPDSTDTLTYSITAGNTGNAFAIDSATGEITVNTALDRETLASYNLTVQVSDGTHTDTAAVTVNLTDVNDNAPTIGDETFTIGEDAAVAASVGTVSASDVDSDDTLTYSIIAGNTGNAFTIDSATGEITVNTALDRETLASYYLTVQVSDGTNSDAATITINVNDVNESTPVANDATVALAENSANGTSVHTVVATDADPTDVLSYSIIGGNGAGVFAIDSGTGEITVADNTNLDREAYASFALTVQVSDGANTDTATITVNVSDVNESTPVATDATVPLTENSANGTSVHTVVATDADPTATLSYAIIGGNGAGVFTINNATGEITVTDNTNLDRESHASFALTVQVSDGTNSDTATITINVSDGNEFTPVANDATVALTENSANGTSVHTVVATDADPTATLSYAIIGGNGAGVFTINSSTGVITVADNANLDRETYASFTLAVEVSDGTNSDTATITINVTDVNDSIPVANDATVTLTENSANGTSVHTVVATDADPTATLTYSIAGGNGAGVFAINSATGEITVADNTNLDRESYASFALTVQVSDGANTDTATITVNVGDVNEFTPVANDATVALAENSANGTSVHTVVATDADPAATLSYAIIGGNGAGVFAINNVTGEITVTDNTNLDREAYASFALTVQVSDGTNTDTATITVNVSDINDSAPLVDNAIVSLAENSPNGTSVHTITATDADPSAILTYSITAGNEAGVFAIDAATGQIILADNAHLDREAYASFTLSVQVSDGVNTGTGEIIVQLTDVNEFAPTVHDASVSLAANAVSGTVVHTVAATDADDSAALTYAIIAGNEQGVFHIDPATGAIVVADNTALDSQTTPSYTLLVQVTDGNFNTTALITITIEDAGSSTPVIDEVEDPVLEEEEERPQNKAKPVPEETAPVNDLVPLPDPTSGEVIGGHGTDRALAPAEDAVDEGTSAPAYAFARRTEYHEIAEYFTTLADQKGLSRQHALQPSDLEETPAFKTSHVEMFSAPESFERESDRMFVGVMAGITALVAGYVGWINNLFSLLIGFFTSAPLWKMLDPVPVIDLGRQKEAHQVDECNEEEDRAEAVDTLFDKKRRS